MIASPEIITPANGIYHGVPSSVYHALPRMSNSILSNGVLEDGGTMLHLKAATDGLLPYDSDALAFGRALHVKLLEPKTFDAQYALCPKLNMTKNVDKAAWAQWEIDNPNKEPLLQDELDKINAIVKAVKGHEEARRRVACVGGFEVTVLWTDEATGIPMKCRIDKWIDASKPMIILDLKGMRSLSTTALERDIYNYGYMRQAAIYTDAIKALTGHRPKFYFLFVEKTYPHAVRLVNLDARAIEIGRAQYRGVLQQWKQCLETNEYPAWGSNIETIGLPTWKLKQWETMMENQDGE